MLSPLRAGAGAPNDLNIRPFVRLSRSQYYGMSYRVEFQMDTLKRVLDVAAPPALRKILRGIEIIHDVSTGNFDKPADYTTIAMVPTPSAGFPWGKGPTLACPLRLNPSACTTLITSERSDPKTVLDIAQIWGCYEAIPWLATHKPGARLTSIDIDPTGTNRGSFYEGTPTPLEFIANMYNFWSGGIEVRLDFITNVPYWSRYDVCRVWPLATIINHYMEKCRKHLYENISFG